jgi:hypothetical protein
MVRTALRSPEGAAGGGRGLPGLEQPRPRGRTFHLERAHEGLPLLDL